MRLHPTPLPLLLAALLWLLASAALPVSAQAAEVRVTGDTLLVTAGPGERNSIGVSTRWSGHTQIDVYESGGAQLTAGPGCQTGPWGANPWPWSRADLAPQERATCDGSQSCALPHQPR